MADDSADEVDVLADILNDGEDFTQFLNAEIPEEPLGNANELLECAKHNDKVVDTDDETNPELSAELDGSKNTTQNLLSNGVQFERRSTDSDDEKSLKRPRNTYVRNDSKKPRNFHVVKDDHKHSKSYIPERFGRRELSDFSNDSYKREIPSLFAKIIEKPEMSHRTDSFNEHGDLNFETGYGRSGDYSFVRGFGRPGGSNFRRGFGRFVASSFGRGFGNTGNSYFGNSRNLYFKRGFERSGDFENHSGRSGDYFGGPEDSYFARDYEKPVDVQLTRGYRRYGDSYMTRSFGRHDSELRFGRAGDENFNRSFRPYEVCANGLWRNGTADFASGDRHREACNETYSRRLNVSYDSQVTKRDSNTSVPKNHKRFRESYGDKSTEKPLDLDIKGNHERSSKSLIKKYSEQSVKSSVRGQSEKFMKPTSNKLDKYMNCAVEKDSEEATACANNTDNDECAKSVVGRLKSTVKRCHEKKLKYVVKKFPEKTLKLKSVITKCTVTHAKSNAAVSTRKTLKSFVGKIIKRPERMIESEHVTRSREMDNTESEKLTEKRAHSTKHSKNLQHDHEKRRKKSEERAEKELSSREHRCSVGTYKHSLCDKSYKRTGSSREHYRRNKQCSKSPSRLSPSRDDKVSGHVSRRDHLSKRKINLGSESEVPKKHPESSPMKVSHHTEENELEIVLQKNDVQEWVLFDKKQLGSKSSKCDAVLSEEKTQRPATEQEKKQVNDKTSGRKKTVKKNKERDLTKFPQFIDDDLMNYELPEFLIDECSSNKSRCDTVITEEKGERLINQQNEEVDTEEISGSKVNSENNEKLSPGKLSHIVVDDLTDYELPDFPNGEKSSAEIQTADHLMACHKTVSNEGNEGRPANQQNEEGNCKKKSGSKLDEKQLRTTYKKRDIQSAEDTHSSFNTEESDSLLPTSSDQMKHPGKEIRKFEQHNMKSSSERNSESRLDEKQICTTNKKWNIQPNEETHSYSNREDCDSLLFTSSDQVKRPGKELRTFKQHNMESSSEKNPESELGEKLICTTNKKQDIQPSEDSHSSSNTDEGDPLLPTSSDQMKHPGKEMRKFEQHNMKSSSEKNSDGQNQDDSTIIIDLCEDTDEDTQNGSMVIIDLCEDSAFEEADTENSNKQITPNMQSSTSGIQNAGISVEQLNEEEANEIQFACITIDQIDENGEISVVTLGHENLHRRQEEILDLDALQPIPVVNLDDEQMQPSSVGTRSYGEYLCKLNHMFRSSKFFLVKTANYRNIEISQQNKVWPTLFETAYKLERAFQKVYNLILIIIVENSSRFAGLARISTESQLLPIPESWTFSPETIHSLVPLFEVDWLCRLELPFRAARYLFNAFHEDSTLIYKCGDGQEVEPLVARDLCRLFPYDREIDMEQILRKARILAATRLREAAEIGGGVHYREQRAYHRFQLARFPAPILIHCKYSYEVFRNASVMHSSPVLHCVSVKHHCSTPINSQQAQSSHTLR